MRRSVLRRVFTDHWAHVFGEIALGSFIVLVVTGVFLAIFFEPSSKVVVYDGSYAPLHGLKVSAAYASTMDISFDVRGGLIVRQMHHWAALLFMAAVVALILRIFFTGAFRRPGRAGWVVAVLVFWTGCLAGYTGYTLPDDALGGTSLRIASGIMLSIPVVGSWLTTSIFNGEVPGEAIIGRLYLVHAIIVPAILVTLIALYIRSVMPQRLSPRRWLQRAGFGVVVIGVLALLGGLVQISPIWLYGPSRAAVAGAASGPEWYLMFLDGASRLMPPWDMTIPIGAGYTIPAIFWATVVLPGLLFVLSIGYPLIEARRNGGTYDHDLPQRPRDVPARTGLGAMAIAFYLVLTAAGATDIIAATFGISANALMWAGRVGVLLLPPLAYYVVYRLCLGLQQHDRQVLVHGVETGIIRRLPDGRFVEVHQPLPALEYAGVAVPKKVNHLGALPPAVEGFFRPIEGPYE
jgi:ubiquinol-cytochrome c reductase cytochrome b subunit